MNGFSTEKTAFKHRYDSKCTCKQKCPYSERRGCICNGCDTKFEFSQQKVRTVDLIPSTKERDKTFIARQARIVVLLHRQRFSAYNEYANSLLQRHPKDRDLRILLSLYEIEKKIIEEGGQISTLQRLSDVEKELRHPQLAHRHVLTALFLTTKGKILSLNKPKGTALAYYQQALQESLSGTPCCLETPYLLHMSSSVKIHIPNEAGRIGIPSGTLWKEVECQWHRAYTQDAEMRDILDEDSLRDGHSLNFFFPFWKGVHYLCALLRSCPLGGFIFFDCMPCPPESLFKARRLIQWIRINRAYMTLRTRIFFFLYKCDYKLRCAERYTKGSSMWSKVLLRAKTEMQKARDLAMVCTAYARNYDLACELRLHYIDQKLSGHGTVDWVDTQRVSPRLLPFVNEVFAKIGISFSTYRKQRGHGNISQIPITENKSGASNEDSDRTELKKWTINSTPTSCMRKPVCPDNPFPCLPSEDTLSGARSQTVPKELSVLRYISQTSNALPSPSPVEIRTTPLHFAWNPISRNRKDTAHKDRGLQGAVDPDTTAVKSRIDQTRCSTLHEVLQSRSVSGVSTGCSPVPEFDFEFAEKPRNHDPVQFNRGQSRMKKDM